jgi:hypothetical protein
MHFYGKLAGLPQRVASDALVIIIAAKLPAR